MPGPLSPLVVVSYVGLVAGCGEASRAPCEPIVAWEAAVAGEATRVSAPRLVKVLDEVYVDLDPIVRGEHAGLTLTHDASCDIVATPISPVPLPESSPDDVVIGDPIARAGRAALVVTGADVEPIVSTSDRAAWDRALAALGVRGRALHAPSRATLEDALAATCTTAGRGVAVLVFAAPGSPAKGGAIVLGAEALSVDRLRELVQTRCADVGLTILVLDTSWLPAPRWADDPAKIVWAASDLVHPGAARLDTHGPGALSTTLTEVVRERAAGCPEALERFDVPLAAWLFRDDDVRARVLAARWRSLGEPALAALARAGALTPTSRDTIARGLEAQVPDALVHTYGTLGPLVACADDDACAGLADTCGLDACERWTCDAGACRARPDAGAPCDDGVDCTEDDTCDTRGLCVGTERACDDGNPCTDDACEPDGCAATPRPGAACDDGDPCTEGDLCDASGACGGAALVCDDGDPCTRDTCDPGSPEAPCVSTPATLACDDGNPCTYSDQCRDRICLGTARACSDDNPCTADACDPDTGLCRFVPLADGAPCDDGDACTSLDRCAVGACAGLERTCDDGLACTFDSCDQGACTHLPTPGTCLASAGCIPVGARPADNPCVVCAATDSLVPIADGEPCADDGILCTIDTCGGGVCRHRDALDQCHDADGRCVGVGERVTDCLVCAGGGVVLAAPEGSACGAPLECAAGACDELGRCVLPTPWPCCPTQVLGCGESLVLAAPNLSGAARVTTWSCDAAARPGPERHVRVTAPCAGTMELYVEGPAGAMLMLDAAPCPAGECSAAEPIHTRSVGLGETLDVAVEVPAYNDDSGDDGGVWVLRTSCACTPGP